MDKLALLVNDSKFESLVLRDILQKIGFSVMIADEYDALYTMECHQPDVAIVNYVLEETSGDKLIQLMKAGRPELLCLLSSNNELRRQDFTGDYIDEILKTPTTKTALESKLVSLVGQNKDHDGQGFLCPRCHADLSSINAEMVFCPFCGSHIEKLSNTSKG